MIVAENDVATSENRTLTLDCKEGNALVIAGAFALVDYDQVVCQTNFE